jgi:hypothetical protein
MEWSQELELDLGSGQGVESKQEPFLELEPNQTQTKSITRRYIIRLSQRRRRRRRRKGSWVRGFGWGGLSMVKRRGSAFVSVKYILKLNF